MIPKDLRGDIRPVNSRLERGIDLGAGIQFVDNDFTGGGFPLGIDIVAGVGRGDRQIACFFGNKSTAGDRQGHGAGAGAIGDQDSTRRILTLRETGKLDRIMHGLSDSVVRLDNIVVIRNADDLKAASASVHILFIITAFKLYLDGLGTDHVAVTIVSIQNEGCLFINSYTHKTGRLEPVPDRAAG